MQKAERANKGSDSPVGSAKGKRPAFVSAKQVQTPLQGGCTQIERTGGSHPAPHAIGKAPAIMQVPNSCGAGGIRIRVFVIIG